MARLRGRITILKYFPEQCCIHDTPKMWSQ